MSVKAIMAAVLSKRHHDDAVHARDAAAGPSASSWTSGLGSRDVERGTAAGGALQARSKDDRELQQQNEELASTRNRPEWYRQDSSLEGVPEEGDEPDGEDVVDEDEDDVEALLEEHGLYIGSYRRLASVYAAVPLTIVTILAVLAAFPTLVWHTPPPSPAALPPHFPPPLPELLAALALWTLAYQLRAPLYVLALRLTRGSPSGAVALAAALSVGTEDVLRVAALPLLLVRHEMAYPRPTPRDAAFARVWWFALGWGAADALVGAAQGYLQIALYRDVLVPPGRAAEVLAHMNEQVSSPPLPAHSEAAAVDQSHGTQHELQPQTGDGIPFSGLGDAEYALHPHTALLRMPGAARREVEQDLDRLLAFKAREELEEVYGQPVIHIPVFVSCLQRANALLLSLGLTLLLSASYLSSRLSLPAGSPVRLPSTPASSPLLSNRAFALGAPAVLAVHLALALVHTPLVLPRVGAHVAAYVGVLAALGALFAGLGTWNAL